MRSEALQAALSDKAQLRRLAFRRECGFLSEHNSRELEKAKRKLAEWWLSKAEYIAEIRWRQCMADGLAQAAVQTELDKELQEEVVKDAEVASSVIEWTQVNPDLHSLLLRRGLPCDMLYFCEILLAGFGHLSLEDAALLNAASPCFEHVPADLAQTVLHAVRPEEPRAKGWLYQLLAPPSSPSHSTASQLVDTSWRDMERGHGQFAKLKAA
eukprot:TRINITY_DN2413_c0_g1_i1.p1 TRINITY_DN2413_c0_g1~~TRINITY_DN2413_c0_g1_i1.p1  ORF type:complete len:212 (-),score=48.15 TRINITY_DN2413_c0_g1_i1:155-790(-)